MYVYSSLLDVLDSSDENNIACVDNKRARHYQVAIIVRK